MAKTKLTLELIDALAELMGEGMYVKHACDIVGITEKSYYEWLRRAEDPGETNPIFSTFSQAMKKATATDLRANLGRIRAAADGGAVLSRTTVTKPNGDTIKTEKYANPAWQAAGWLSERRHDEYKQQRGDQGGTQPNLLLFAKIEFLDVQGGAQLDSMEVADLGLGEPNQR